MRTSGSVSVEPARAQRLSISVEGAVQGMGFRPFVCRLARRLGLTGSIRNTRQGVHIEAQGDAPSLEAFLAALGDAHVTVSVSAREPVGDVGFTIAETGLDGPTRVAPIPDVAVCATCLRELDDPNDRRRGYPLLTCAACGPRFTIVRALPWDRERTTLSAFEPCARCREDYGNPHDRRFHAEGIACPDCGPRLSVHGPDGAQRTAGDPVSVAAHALREGRIVALKGVGGYHLACDATSSTAVAELRRRKRREAKPLAVMVRDLDAAHRLAALSDAEAQLLSAAVRPIVLVTRRAGSPIAGEVAPGCRELGLMLPYTPLHHLLLHALDVPLVMTSGNGSDEPIAHRDDDALRRLRGVADLFVMHDRPIQAPCDDSVARVSAGAPRLIRRSRGYVPRAITLPVSAPRPVLACGGELKSTFALVRGDDAFLSQHLGDLTSEAAFRGFVDAVGHFRGLLDLTPDVVAHDLHPAYRSTVYARALDGVERVAVQHHHAHVAACLADNGVDRPVIGVAWDGTGYGPDGRVWGGEFLVADLAGFERAGHFESVPMPGGEAAVREPWRMAAVFLRAAYGEAIAGLDLAFVRRLDGAAWRVLSRAADRGLNAPLTSSAGRLFDAVASLLGLRDRVAFEAQAAMELEALAEREADTIYPVALADRGSLLVVRTPDVIRGVVEDLLRETPAPLIAARFHATLADALVRVCAAIRRRTGLGSVALSGGVFQNAWLLEAASGRLRDDGFEVFSHRQVPANDGGLALGQAAVAARRLADRSAR